MKLGTHGLNLIKSFEGFVPYVYDDLVAPVRGKYREWDGGPVRGTLTIGYGHTNAARHPLKCVQGARITEKQATEILDFDLDQCEEEVNRLVKAKLTQGQFDALVSFDYNCGVGNLRKVIVPLNQGDYDTTREKFGRYIRSKGQVLNGLVRRRTAEQELWDDEYDEAQSPAPDKPVLTPKDVVPIEEPKTAIKSRTVWSVIVAIATAVWAWFQSLNPSVQVALILLVCIVAYIAYERIKKADIVLPKFIRDYLPES